jgi:2-polyprenyl-3-methyl-5-hydroxy-6-metoxy-1,4-benzoquinol methylase/uncharacterized protein YbaR (Trm112 family)
MIEKNTSTINKALTCVVCPRDRTELRQDNDSLVCLQGHRFPIIDGIPVLLLEELPTNTAIAESIAYAATREGEEFLYEGEDVHPQVSQMVSATSGILYAQLVGNLPRYPIPELRLGGGAGREFLDIGCNWGRWCFAAARKGYRVVGLDPHLHSLRAAQVVAKQLGLDVTFICGDARAMPFRDERFDVAFSYSVIQHFSRPDARTTVAEIGRILRPGGMSFVQMPNAVALRSFYHLARRRFEDGGGFDVRYWTRRSLKQLFGQLVGATSLSVDGFFGLGIQASDRDLLPLRYRAVIGASELLRKVTDFFPPLAAVADSQYVTSVKQPSQKAG